MKRAFGIIQALIIMILVSFLLMMVLKSASVSVKHVSDSYVKEQAELFLFSSIENAILAIEGYERSSNCLKTIRFVSQDARFISDIKILKYYCYDATKCPCGSSFEKIESEDSHGTVLLSVSVESNTTHPKNIDKRIRMTKLTLQRP